VLPCTTEVRFKLDHLIGTLHFHFNSAAEVQKAHSPVLPKTIPNYGNPLVCSKSYPGIGWIWPHTQWLGWGLARDENVALDSGFLGLVSSEHSTGDKVNRGSITPHWQQSPAQQVLIQSALGGDCQRARTAGFLRPHL